MNDKAKLLGFEAINPVYQDTFCPGLTKREYFAGLTMQGILANTDLIRESRHNFERCSTVSVAKKSAEYADALLAELSKEE